MVHWRQGMFTLVWSPLYKFVQLTFVDFFLYELLDQHRMFEPSLFDELANLKVSMN